VSPVTNASEIDVLPQPFREGSIPGALAFLPALRIHAGFFEKEKLRDLTIRSGNFQFCLAKDIWRTETGRQRIDHMEALSRNSV
jgi:hypothetical protein